MGKPPNFSELIMAFCSAARVEAVVDTDMSTAEITDLITETQALMVMTLDTGTLNATVLQAICRLWTAISVMEKDPNSRRLGEYSEDRRDQIKTLRERLDWYMRIADGGIRLIATREELT